MPHQTALDTLTLHMRFLIPPHVPQRERALLFFNNGFRYIPV